MVYGVYRWNALRQMVIRQKSVGEKAFKEIEQCHSIQVEGDCRDGRNGVIDLPPTGTNDVGEQGR